nr:MAG TPA: hypothetical protein [Caudoviricetes sp.]
MSSPYDNTYTAHAITNSVILNIWSGIPIEIYGYTKDNNNIINSK